jgi:hypothetical protein
MFKMVGAGHKRVGASVKGQEDILQNMLLWFEGVGTSGVIHKEV